MERKYFIVWFEDIQWNTESFDDVSLAIKKYLSLLYNFSVSEVYFTKKVQVNAEITIVDGDSVESVRIEENEWE